MAAPTIRTVTFPQIATNNALPAATGSSAIQAGDMVLAFLWSQGADQTTLTHTIQGADGWVSVRSHAHDDGTTDGRLSVAYKIAQSGSVVQTFAPFAVANATAAQQSIGLVVLSTGSFKRTGITSNSTTLTTNAVPNPPALTGLTGDHLVFAVGAWHVTTGGATATAPGANYTEQVENPVASHVTHLAIATRAMTALSNATEDPPAFTDNVAPNGSVSMAFNIPGVVLFTRTAAVDAVAAATVANREFFTTFSRSLTVEAVGSIDASGVAAPSFTVHERSAAVAASADVTAAATFFTTFERFFIVDATAAIAASGQRELLRSAGAGAAASAESAGVKAVLRSAAVSATTECDVAGDVWQGHTAQAAVSATASPAATGQRDLLRSSSVSAAASQSTSGQRDLLRSSSVAAIAAIVSVGIGFSVHERSSSASAVADAAAAGDKSLERFSLVAAVPGISAVGQRDLHRSSGVSASAAASVSGRRDVLRSASVGAVAAADASQVRVHQRSASLGASADVASIGASTIVHQRSAAAGASAGVDTSGQRIHCRSSSVGATCSLAATRQVELNRSCSIRAEASVTHGVTPGVKRLGHMTDRRMGRGRRIISVGT